MDQSPSWQANIPSASQEIFSFCGTGKFITLFTTASHLFLSWARWIHSTHFHPIFKIRFEYFLTMYAWVFQIVPFLQVFIPKSFMHFSFPPNVPHAQPISSYIITLNAVSNLYRVTKRIFGLKTRYWGRLGLLILCFCRNLSQLVEFWGTRWIRGSKLMNSFCWQPWEIPWSRLEGKNTGLFVKVDWLISFPMVGFR